MARKAPAKTAAKSAGRKKAKRKPGRVAQPHGGELLTGGVPGNRGGTGRPPDLFRQRMAELTSSVEVEGYLTDCLRGVHGPKAFNSAYKYATEQAHGKATQTTKLEGDEQKPLVIRVVTT